MKMPSGLELDAELLAIGALAVLILSKAGAQVAEAVVTTAGEAAGQVASGAVVGTGKLLGIPATNRAQCQIDIDNGDVWAASFSCPLGDFLAFKKSWEQ